MLSILEKCPAPTFSGVTFAKPTIKLIASRTDDKPIQAILIPCTKCLTPHQEPTWVWDDQGGDIRRPGILKVLQGNLWPNKFKLLSKSIEKYEEKLSVLAKSMVYRGHDNIKSLMEFYEYFMNAH